LVQELWGYLTPLVLPIIIGFFGAIDRGCKSSAFYSCFFSGWYRDTIGFSKDLWVISAIFGGLLGSFVFDRYFLQNEVKNRVLRQILGFLTFFWIIPALIFVAGAFLGVIWIA